MIHQTIHLKDRFPFLGENGCDPILQTYLLSNIETMGRQDRKHPCMVICPGGAYSHCSLREAEPIAVHLLPEGFHVFVLHYSTAPNRFPIQLRQVAAVMELIYENAEEWHCDTDRIAMMGFSAGGHLAAHYTNCFDCNEVRQVFPDSKGVNASVLCYPVITADPQYAHRGSFKNLLGHFPEEEAEREKYSCNRLVSERTPPTFLWHTRTDASVPVMNSLLYAQALSTHGVSFEMHIYPHGKHGLSTADCHTNDEIPEEAMYTRDWLPAVKKWLNQVFSIY